MFILSKKNFVYIMVGIFLMSCSNNNSNSQDKIDPTPKPELPMSLSSIGAIQYNVKKYAKDDKRDTWGNETFRKEQVSSIEKVIQGSDPVDFIAFEMGDSPKLSDELKKRGLHNWESLVNPSSNKQKERSENQITYNTDRWELIENGSNINGNNKIKGFRNGYWMGEFNNGEWDFSSISSNHDIVHHNIRIYYLGYFLFKGDKKTKVLFVAIHFPHYQEFGPDKWNWQQFHTFVRELVGNETNLGDVHMIFAGDMNMSKADFHDNVNIPHYLKDFGSFHLSNDLETCCNNKDHTFVNPFDHVATNKGEINKAFILPKTGTFNAQGEEHKAIYVEIKLNN